MTKKFIKLTVIVCLIISAVVQFAPKKANAVLGVADYTFTTQIADVSASGLSNWANIIGTHLKDFVLDRLATIIAKQILHKLTLQVIDWINSGYEGQPAFLTNPGDFFSDVADHITGDFIANGGPLSKLCSPFSIDIRVGITLQQSQQYNDRYACTLSSVINNTKNGVTLNGRSVEGFIAGDFSQGGWPAFIAMTTQPKNNAAGAYLQAQSELQASIVQKHSAVALDLQIGGGFLSYETCNDVTGTIGNGNDSTNDGVLTNTEQSQLNKKGDQSILTGHDQFGNNSTIQKKVDSKTGAVSYKDCQTQTPGSVVASKLFTNINSPEVELELANSINSIVSAAITQLASSVLSKGLHALSKSGSGTSGRSYTQDALQDITNQSRTDMASTQAAAAAASASASTQPLAINKASYDQAVSIVNGAKSGLAAAAACFDGKSGGTYPAAQAAAARAWSATRIDPILAGLVSKQQISAAQIAQAQTNGLSSPQSLQDLQQQIPTYQDSIQQSVASSGQVDTDTAANDLKTAQALAQQGNQLSAQYQAACNAYPAQQIIVATP